MIRIEQCEPEKERICEDCEEASICPYVGSSPMYFSDGGEVKCLVVDKREGSVSLLIPTTIQVLRGGKVDGYQVSVHRFRQGKLWRWFRSVFA
jgi:hypothetical protein